LAVVNLEAGEFSRNRGIPGLKSLRHADDARIEFSRLIEIVHLHGDVGDAHDSRPLRRRGGNRNHNGQPAECPE
jgi:hypothetical protein